MVTSVSNAPQSSVNYIPQSEVNSATLLNQIQGGSIGQPTSFVDRARGLNGGAPTGLEAFASSPTSLETLAAQPSFQLAQARDNDRRTTIEVRAPTSGVNEKGPGFPGSIRTNNDASIRITVRELRPDELGSLAGKTGQNLQTELNRAAAQIDRENRNNANGKSTAELREMSIASGYYNSPSHQAWAQAAEARTGGKVPAEWWIRNDPFGGTNGNGPNILAGGVYPHPLSRIGMAHDTDWTLGRAFGAGPMRTLATSSDPRGDFGLTTQGANRAEHERSLDAGLGSGYLSGHPDWNVEYRGR
jgi:hypothetical protein